MVEIDMQKSLDYDEAPPTASYFDQSESSTPYRSTNYNAAGGNNFSESDDFGVFVRDDDDDYNVANGYVPETSYPAALRSAPVSSETAADSKEKVKRRKNKEESRSATSPGDGKRKSMAAASDSVETLVRRFRIFFPKSRQQRSKSVHNSAPINNNNNQEVVAEMPPPTNLRNFSFASSKIGRQYDDYEMGCHDDITDLDDPMEFGHLGIGATEMSTYSPQQHHHAPDQSRLSGSSPPLHDWSMDDPITVDEVDPVGSDSPAVLETQEDNAEDSYNNYNEAAYASNHGHGEDYKYGGIHGNEDDDYKYGGNHGNNDDDYNYAGNHGNNDADDVTTDDVTTDENHYANMDDKPRLPPAPSPAPYLDDRPLKVFKSPEAEEGVAKRGVVKSGGGLNDAWKRLSSYFSLKKEKAWSVDAAMNERL